MPVSARPDVVVIAGPNGAGKTSSSNVILPQFLAVRHFVNADVIAAGLSRFDPGSVAIAAGRLMLMRIEELASRRQSFAFETTLASRFFAVLLRRLASEGYGVHVIYLWLPDPELAIARVAGRVRRGGQHVPSEIVRRRYWAGLRNFFALYQPIADTWRFYNNGGDEPVLIASGAEGEPERIAAPELWIRIRNEVHGHD